MTADGTESGADTGSDADAAALHDFRQALDSAVEALRNARARDEAHARFEPSRRVAIVIARPPRMVPLGRVWRLGVLLLAPDGTLHRTGEITRALEPKRANHQARSAEIRRAYRAAAHRGRFVEGEVVNFATTPLRLDAPSLREGDDPLLLRDGALLVRWNRHDPAALRPATAYLAERVDALLHPPEGA